MPYQSILEDNNSQTKIWGYRRNYWKTALAWTSYLCTGFFLRLVFEWLPRYHLYAEFSECEIGFGTDKILCCDQFGQYWIHNVSYNGLKNSNDYGTIKNNTNDLFDIIENQNMNMIYFIHKKLKYIWNWKLNKFEQVKDLEGEPISEIVDGPPLSTSEVNMRRILYDSNEINIRLTSIPKLLLKEGLNPFYVFQLASCILWFLDQYTIYATCIVIMSSISLGVELYETRTNEKALRDRVENSGQVTVQRQKSFVETVESNGVISQDLLYEDTINATELVPGDIVLLPRSGCELKCDLVLLSGTAIINESMLTGESVPVTKTSLTVSPTEKNELLVIDANKSNKKNISDPIKEGKPPTIVTHARHIMYCGTRLIQGRDHGPVSRPLRARVVRTGYRTAKGGLVRSILFPSPTDIKFTRDTVKFILVLAAFALIGMVYTIKVMLLRGISVSRIIMRSLDLITIIVPPALPLSMTIGIVFAQARLKKKNIFCISPNTINIAGGVNLACFDKTGTLTEEGLDLLGFLRNRADGSLETEMDKPPILTPSYSMDPADGSDRNTHHIECMACCHTLTYIEGELCGDPLDLKMFQATQWTLQEGVPRENEGGDEDKNEPNETAASEGDVSQQVSNNYDATVPVIISPPNGVDGPKIGILRQFPFSSANQRMSVVARHMGANHFTLFAKGSPEMISSICRKDTIPRDFSSRLISFTREGYRVLALAYRPLRTSLPRVMRTGRSSLEKELRFLGLLIMENRLKPATNAVIEELHTALIRPVMVTGDNMLTALSVARDSGIVAEQDRVVLVDARLETDSAGNVIPIVEMHYADDLQRSLPVQEVVVTSSGNKEVSPDGVRGNTIKLTVLDHSDFHLALTGRTWSILRDKCSPQLLGKLACKGSVFARFSPDQKAQLVQVFQKLGCIVGMCGDGANDCGALKTAHAGISLSDSEASVASPFTSKTPDISCIPDLIREGRCSLSTSYGIFRYMAGYSFTQFVSVLFLYWFSANLGDLQFLYIDLILLTSLSITYAWTRAHTSLSPQQPTIRLLSVSMVLSLVVQWLLNLFFQLAAFWYVSKQPWYFMPPAMGDEPIHLSYTNTAIFVTSSFQYIILAVVFSRSSPFRAPLYTNYLFLANIIICLLFNLYLTIYPFHWLSYNLELQEFPSFYVPLIFISFACANYVLSFLFESIFERWELHSRITVMKESLFPKLLANILRQGGGNSQSHTEYDRLRDEIKQGNLGSIWPPVYRFASVQDLRPDIFTDIPSSNTNKAGGSQLNRHHSNTDIVSGVDGANWVRSSLGSTPALGQQQSTTSDKVNNNIDTLLEEDDFADIKLLEEPDGKMNSINNDASITIVKSNNLNKGEDLC